MTKEDKQIIDRATKEEWRIGDRTRLKRLLEKNLEQYRDKVELEDRLAEEVELHLHAEEYNKSLEEENNKLLDVINNQDVKIADLESKNAELKERYDKVDIIGYDALKNITKAKNIIKTLADDLSMYSGDYQKELLEAKQFIKEIEK